MDNRATVELTADDRVELYYMLRGRGESGLKTKLIEALTQLDTQLEQELRNEGDNQ